MNESPKTLQAAGEWFAAINAHDSTRLANILGDGFVWEIAEVVIEGRVAATLAWRQLWSGLPDLHLEVEEQLKSEEFVAARWQLSGTHRGELRLQGISPAGSKDRPPSFLPTGRRVVIRGCTVLRVEGGKVAHCLDYGDTLGLMRQLGVVP